MGRKLTYDEVKSYVENNSDCVLLPCEYKGVNNKLKFKCGCGKDFERDFAHFKTRKQVVCKSCSMRNNPKSQPLSNDNFIMRVKESVGDEYLFIEKYINARTKIKVQHITCGYEYSVTPDKFIGKCKRRCPYCYGSVVDTENIFRLKLKRKFKEEYTLTGKYQDSRTRTEFKHNTCGHVFKVSPDNLIRGMVSCHRCNTSNGERKIIDILTDCNLNYETQRKFNECKSVRPLPFDFSINDNTGASILLIEYDGIQHFKSVKFFGGEEKIKLQRIRDQIKNDYCFKNNIPLLRIPYWESENIEHILFDFLVEHGALEEITV